ncbi:MAG: polysaccharide biosynthesis tyrosine autokinase [Bythopirellula sp.]|nr:polysaccharide biosynthesis tyrosine autokinase [Bythopirellula sp.]
MVKQDSGFSDSQVMYPPSVDGNGSMQMVPMGSYPAPVPAVQGPMLPHGPEILTGPLNQTWLMNCLRRRWLSALLLGTLAAGLAGLLLMYMFPLSSQIVAYLQVETEEAGDIFEGASGRTNPKEFEIFQQTQLTLLKSQFVLKAALARRDIAELNAVLSHRPNEVAWLTEDLKVSFPGESKILMLKYEGQENPEDMKKVVDAVIAAYQNDVVFADRTSKIEMHNSMEKLHAEINEQLKEKIDRVETLREELGGAQSPNANAELNMLIREISVINGQMIKMKEELMDLEVNRELQTRAANSPAALAAAVAAALDADPTIQQYQQQQYAISQQILQLESISKRATPEINRLKQQMQQIGQQQEDYRMRSEAEIRNKLKTAPNDQLQLVMTEYLMRRQMINQQMTELQTELDGKKEQINALGQSNGELAMLQAEVDQLSEIAQTMDYKLRSWNIQEGAAAEQIKVIQPPFSTEKINVFERYAIATLGAIAAFCGTCYGIALLEFRRRKLNSPSDVDEGLGIRVLGVLPTVSSRKSMAPGSITAAQLSESIDNVRATLMHDSTSRPRQIVLVASPSSMEGSTTVASHLALSLTRAGRRTLLIDGDLRDPALHKLFGMPLEDGVSELLRSEIEISDAIRPTNTEGLWLMTAGICDMDAIHALATDQLQPIFEKLRAEFDFVIIDGAPVLGLSDSLSIGQHIDGAILTVLRDHSGVRSIHQASELLKSLGIRLIGCVVNGMPFKADRRITRVQRGPGSKAKRLPAAES